MRFFIEIRTRCLLHDNCCELLQIRDRITPIIFFFLFTFQVSYRWELIDDTSGKNDSDTMEIIGNEHIFLIALDQLVH